jgi:hypothetical protein
MDCSVIDPPEILFTLCVYILCKLKYDRNSACPCGSKEKYKHCCLNLDQERATWDDLEDKLRVQINEIDLVDRFIEVLLFIYLEYQAKVL